MPLPSVFQGVQDCRLPAFKPPKRFQPSRRPPRQQLLQLHVPAICFSGGSRLPFARPQTPQTLPTLPQASKATTLTATCPCHLFFRRFKTAVCPASNPPRFRRPPRQQLLQLHAPAICFSGGSRLPFAHPQTPQTLQTLPQASKATTLTATCPCHAICFSGGSRLPFARPQTPQTLPQASKATTLKAIRLHAAAICFSGGSRLPFARPQTPQTLPQASKATTLTATCPCHLFFRGFKTAVCPPSNPPKRFQPFRRPPRQQLLQLLHAPAICFSGGSRLPFARPQTPQTLPTPPQASKATTLTATTCPCHLFFRGFKTAVCPPSNPPNPSAGLQGNNSYSYMPLPSVFQGVQDCRLPALKPPKPFRRPPRQQLLRLHAPAICFSGGSRLPFARPQTPQTLPQASKATTLTATCPCHLFFRGFKTAVCPPSNPPKRFQPFRRPPRQQLLQLHAPAICFSGGSRLPFARPQTPQTLPTLPQACSNNSYSYYMPLTSVFQGVQDCRLPALKRPKRFQPFRRPPRQQLLQLDAPAICFSGGSRLPFARPQTPQTLPTLPQASKATTLTATCPCHLFFRGFKTAVCPASNPPNASNPPAGLQGNNSYSYMPLPSVFQEVQDCRLPGLKPSKRFRRPPRQQLLQLHAPAICFSGGSRLPFARPQTPQMLQTLPQASKATTLTATCPCHAICFSGGSRLPFARPQTPQTLPQASKATTLKAIRLHAPAICFSGGSRLPFARPQTPQTLPQASKATTLTATCPCHLFFRGFKTAVCPPSNPPKRFQPFRRPPRQQLLQLLHAPAICFSGGSRLPFARPQTPQTLPTLPQASKATTLTARCPCHLFFRGFKTAVCPPSNPPNASNPPAGLQGNNSYSYMSLPSVFQGVQDCRLPGLKPPKRFQPSRRPPRQQLLQLHAPAICFSGGSRLPFARPQTLQTLPQASKATTLTATCPCHLFFRGFKTAVCPPSNPPNASNPPAGLQGNNSYSYMSLPSVFQGVQDCRLPGLKPPKRFQPSRRPPRQQLLQLHAPAICFSGGSRLPFARPQTLQTLPQASKATTLTATCPCHLFFRGFKTAVCPPSNPPNASNPPAGLQGNNSYSYMSLPSVFQGVQDCRLPALKPPKPFRRPPRQQLLQLHAPAICFSGGSRLPFARPQTPQTLPQASKATTLKATCPCHLFFRGFKTAVCPPSNPPNPSAGLQGNNSYSYMPLPSVFQGVQDCRLPALKPPQTLPTLPQASKATTLTATCPCHLFFRGFKTAVCPPSNPPNASNPPAGLQGNNSYSYYMPLPSVFQGVQDCRLPALKRPKRFQPFRRPPRQQLLQLHAPAICFSGGSRLPFARPRMRWGIPAAKFLPKQKQMLTDASFVKNVKKNNAD